MAECQHSRGPDYTGFWNDGARAALAHNRLAIIDLSPEGRQPMESDDWVIVFNGEIYNYAEIRPGLEELGVVFRGHSDTEVLLHCLQRRGLDSTLQLIHGMFAIAAWHKPSGTLHLVRDRMGIKPLFYHHGEDGSVAFASTAAALARTRADKWRLNRGALYEFFRLGAVFSEDTLFAGIQRLDAAHVATFVNGDWSVRRYWKPEPRSGDLGDLIFTAVEARRISDVPVCVFLSGGVDSSAVSVILRDVDGVHLESVEKEYARHVTDAIGGKLHVVDPQDFDMDAVLSDYAGTSGEPSMAGMIPYVVSRAIRDLGYIVGISANGADELFYGYPRMPTPGLPTDHFSLVPHDPLQQADLTTQLLEIFRHPGNFSVPDSPEPLSLLAFVAQMEEKYFLDGFPRESSYRWLELQTYVKYDLNATLDFASMASSVEMREPFLDYRLVECALALDPAEVVTPEFGRKAPLKRILQEAGIHPALWCRAKRGFSLNSKADQSLRRRRLQSVKMLREQGYLRLADAAAWRGNVHRDQAYLFNAAWAFEVWKRVWIDSGIVTP